MKKTMTILAIAGLILALAPAAQAATLTVNNTNSDMRTELSSGGVINDILPGRILVGANTGKMIFGDISIDVSSLITGVEGDDTYVDAADFNANAAVSLDFEVVILNVTNPTDLAGTDSRTFAIYTDGVPGIVGQGTVLGTIGTTTAGLGAKSISLPADANGYELGAMATDNLTLDAFVNNLGTAEYEFTGAQLVVTRVPEPATMSLLAIGGIALLRRKRRA